MAHGDEGNCIGSFVLENTGSSDWLWGQGPGNDDLVFAVHSTANLAAAPSAALFPSAAQVITGEEWVLVAQTDGAEVLSAQDFQDGRFSSSSSIQPCASLLFSERSVLRVAMGAGKSAAVDYFRLEPSRGHQYTACDLIDRAQPSLQWAPAAGGPWGAPQHVLCCSVAVGPPITTANLDQRGCSTWRLLCRSLQQPL